ncbi:hypothetical protein [Paraburkholderia phenoliruptrix]|uniref:Uncharacterized protein n=1 Tax=Paraburkholderia phenoliruptrix BR3459a TaxID=1229205 RepID=K0E0L4_9BURK|nr:hypothetical protein [Paraburkholderia phenoliruptrix]AFT89993.1 hypothetical protein BUPH_08328 [Paraburkholderia phenoliruptrix BR3459a]
MTNPQRRLRQIVKVVCAGCLLLALDAFADSAPSSTRVDDASLRARAVTAESHGVRVSAAVLGADDDERMFGTNLNIADVQPVWVEVTNRTLLYLWMFRTESGEGYYLPFESAWPVHTRPGGAAKVNIDDRFYKASFKNPIPPGGTRAGILFTNRVEGLKFCSIDLSGDIEVFHFSLFLPVPDDDENFEKIRFLVTGGGSSVKTIPEIVASECAGILCLPKRHSPGSVGQAGFSRKAR